MQNSETVNAGSILGATTKGYMALTMLFELKVHYKNEISLKQVKNCFMYPRKIVADLKTNNVFMVIGSSLKRFSFAVLRC